MSIKAIAWAWKQNITATDKLVLLALADYADARHLAWPSIKALYEKTGLSRRAVFYALKNLEACNALHLIRRHNDRGQVIVSYYHLAVGGALDALDRCKICTGIVHDVHPPSAPRALSIYSYDPSIDPSVDPKEASASLSDAPAAERLTPQDLVDGWNDICAIDGSLPKVRELTASRKSKALQRIKEHPEPGWWDATMTNIANSPFCCGQVPGKNGAQSWRADFDWLIRNDVNAQRAFEGRYNDAKGKRF